MRIDMVMVHEKVSSVELPHLDLIRQSLRRKRRKTWQEVLILLNIEGCVTVWRDYHSDVFAAQAERFFSKLIEKEYALLDEMTDFGYPQYMEARILKEFIKTDAYRMEVTQRPPMAVTSSLLKERRDTVQ